MFDIELSDLEVPSWPVEAYPFEPVHSLFARFAERNGQASTAVFARHVGINWTHPNLSELSSFCSKYPVRQWAKSVAATPILEGGQVIINGQVLNPHTDWSIYQPRVCEGCLHEAAYYRNWWDITAIHYCPLHDRPLVSGGKKGRLSLWYSRVGETSDGENLAKYAPRAGVSAHPWEQYLLGRMGVLEATPQPLLDPVALIHIIEAVELLGSAALGPFRDKVRQRPAGLSSERASILAAGASIALSGAGAITDCIYKYVEAKQRASKMAGRRLSHPAIFRGRLARLAEQSENPLFPLFRRELDRAIDDLKIYARRVKGSAPLAARPLRIPLKKLASQMGLSKHQLRRLAVRLNLVPEMPAHGTYTNLSSGDADFLNQVHGELVRRRDAVSRAGLSDKDFDRLCKVVGIGPYVRFGRGRPGDHFRNGDLEALRQYCADHSDALVAEGEGALHRTFRPRAISKRPGLSYSDVATSLGVSPTTIKPLIAARHLSLVNTGGAFRARVDTGSVDAFKSKYAAAQLYSEYLKCRPSSAYAMLEKLGVVKLANVDATGASFVRRRDVCDALNIQFDPYAAQNVQEGRFWDHFARHLAKIDRGSMRVYGSRKAERVRLFSGDRTLSAEFHIDRVSNTITYELVCDALTSSRRYHRLCKHLPEVIRRLGLSAVDMQSESHIVIREGRACNLDNENGWPAVFDWIEAQMAYFRSIFTPKAPCQQTPEVSAQCLRRAVPVEYASQHQ
jgi:hypothetical protein